MSLFLYEDPTQPELLPLTHVNPDFDMRCGAWTVRERTAHLLAGWGMSLVVRTRMAAVMRERSKLAVNAPFEDATLGGGPTLFISGRALFTSADAAALTAGGDAAYYSGEDLVALRFTDALQAQALHDSLSAALHSVSEGVHAKALARMHALVRALPRRDLTVAVIHHPWDLIAHNRSMLASDALSFALGLRGDGARVSPHAILCDEAAIAIGDHAVIAAGAILDAAAGPILIGAHADIQHGAIVRGPVFIGPHARVKAGAKIHEGTVIGPHCRVGGEVEDVIFHSYANKQHEGFAGHSYFAPWTNLGADTNTSDLKNNYSPVRMTLEGIEHDTGTVFLGSILADHTKTAINTQLNTGTTAGVGCNIFGGDFPPKYLPSFSWGGDAGLITHDLGRFLRTAEIVMMRRDCILTANERDLLAHVFAATLPQRASFATTT